MHRETSLLVKSHQTGREKNPCWGFCSLKQTEGSLVTCCTSTLLTLHPCTEQLQQEHHLSGQTTKGKCWLLKRINNKWALSKCHMNASTTKIIRLQFVQQGVHAALFFQSQECEESWSNHVTVKRRASFLKEQKKMLAVGSDGQGLLSLVLLPFSVFGHEQKLWKLGVLLGTRVIIRTLIHWDGKKLTVRRKNFLKLNSNSQEPNESLDFVSAYCPI